MIEYEAKIIKVGNGHYITVLVALINCKVLSIKKKVLVNLKQMEDINVKNKNKS